MKRSKNLTCVYCRKKGASVDCSVKVSQTLKYQLLQIILQECFRTYHLNCGISKGCLNRHDKFISYCPSHRPQYVPPTPRPLCHLCSMPVTKDWVQCPSCTIGLHRSCQQERANKGLVTCPACHEGPSFKEEMNFYGIWFRSLAE